MKVEHKEHTTLIKDTQGDALDFLEKVIHEHASFKNNNIIVDISRSKNVTLSIVKRFVPLAKLHQKNKKSFVLVAENIDFTAVPNSIIVVPSVLEAHDIIEMEEIERDLGF